MKDITFHDAWPDIDALYDYEPTLFHLPGHLWLQRDSGWIGFYALDQKTKRIVASLFVNMEENKGTTAVRSPYGGIECASTLPAETLYEFIRFIDSSLGRIATEVEIKMPPEAYAPVTHACLFSFLHAVGYKTIRADLSSCIKVTGNFAGAIRKKESQVLHRAQHAGLTGSLMSGDKFAEAYSFIAYHHSLKKYPVSMTWSQLAQAATSFPGRYLTFGVHSDDTLVGAAIAIRVSSNVLNLFYIDHDGQYDKLSPPVLLIAALYDYCAVNHISLLDLGTSSLPDGPNLSLLSFKMRMGGQPSIKPVLRKQYRNA